MVRELTAGNGGEKREEIAFITNHQLNVLCGRNQRDFDYLQKWQAYVYRKPWDKLDVHVDVTGEQSVGKSLALGQLYVKVFGQEFVLFIQDVSQLKEQFNSELEKLLLMIVEECASPNNHNLTNYIKGILDSNKEKQFNEKGIPKWKGKVYYKAMFFTNEEWAQMVGDRERRFFMLKAMDNGYIDKVCKKKGWNQRADYFNYMHQIDPRSWAYYLGHVVEIKDFDPRRDCPITQETAAQVTRSLWKLSPVKSFWYKLLSDELHIAIGMSKGMDVSHVVASLQQATKEADVKDSVLAFIEKLKAKQIAESYWEFNPSDKEWKEVIDLLRRVPPKEKEDKKVVSALLDKAVGKHAGTVDYQLNEDIRACLLHSCPAELARSLSSVSRRCI